MRASWGQKVAFCIEWLSYSTDMSSSGIYPLTGGNGFTTGVNPASLGNEELKWETSEQLDFGVDARFLRDRLTFSVDYYEKKTKDLLVLDTKPSLSIGGKTSPRNAGNVSNKGWEFELGWRDNIKDFSYSIRANLATLKNEVTYLDPSQPRLNGASFHTYQLSFFEKGYPVYYFRGYQFNGLDEQGNPTFKDLDNSGGLNEGDLTYIGDAIPDFTYGITLTAAYKGLDLTIFGTGSQANDIFLCYYRPDYSKSNRLKEVLYDIMVYKQSDRYRYFGNANNNRQ